ncbi:uncharacterized protein LOC100377819 [Saccoglossus kowalevskii]|uniref:Uncharacterized protein LOC100377819 n=1 Tax=Saccoglossus kowalevskii TaxID=10224 RepID=A0ABM0GM77_SACKO|nr:PREDICTED: uncharacterized protein LOC100377819 [Saccoglossus kowalevskii]
MRSSVGRHLNLIPVLYLYLIPQHLTQAACDVNFDPPEHGSFRNNPTSVDTYGVLFIECDQNYTLSGQSSLFCMGSFFLSLNLPDCVANCADPGAPEAGSRSPDPTQPHNLYRHGDVIDFQCDRGSSQQGAPSSTCTDGEWNPVNVPPPCQADCGDPGTPVNGHQLEGGSYLHNGIVQFACDAGILLMHLPVVDRETGKLSHSPKAATPGEDDSKNTSNEFFLIPTATTVIIHSVVVMVTSGGDLKSDDVNNITVDAIVTSSSLGTDISGSGLWDIEIYLQDSNGDNYTVDSPTLSSDESNQTLLSGGEIRFNDIEFSVNGSEIPCSDSLEVCVILRKGISPNPDFELSGVQNEISLTGCQSVTCGTCQDPGSPVNGRQETGASFVNGGVVEFVCDLGILVGTNQITCYDGEWNDVIPSCAIVIINNVMVTVTSSNELNGNGINDVFLNIAATSSILGSDVTGTDLWGLEVFLQNTEGDMNVPFVPQLTSEEAGQRLSPGDQILFNGIQYTVDGSQIPCDETLEVCVTLKKGNSPSPNFVLSGDPDDEALTGCQSMSCDVDECQDPDICPPPNHVCENVPGTFYCRCAGGYSGEDCHVTDNCVPVNPCQNEGNCTSSLNSYQCQCASGFGGIDCGEEIDYCDPNPCQNASICKNSTFGYKCECRLGFEGDVCNETVPYFTVCPEGETRVYTLEANSTHAYVNITLAAEDWLQRNLTVESVGHDVTLPGTVEFSMDFRHGREVWFRATDENRNIAYCVFMLQLIDAEPPDITCPVNVFLTTTRTSDAAVWPLATAHDNIGLHPIKPITYNRQNGSELFAGEQRHHVTATATDSSENTASCNFTVSLRKTEEPPKTSPLTAIIAGSILGIVALIIIVVFISVLICHRRTAHDDSKAYMHDRSRHFQDQIDMKAQNRSNYYGQGQQQTSHNGTFDNPTIDIHR